MNGTTGVWTKVTLVALVAATLLGTVVMAKAAEATYDCPNGAVTVLPDDTLWGIAEAYCTTGDLRAIVHDMQLQNPHIGDTLFPGDELRLPAPERADMVEIIGLGLFSGMMFSLPIFTFAGIMAAAVVAMFKAGMRMPLMLKKLGLVFTALALASMTAILVGCWVKFIILGLELPWESVAVGSGLTMIWMGSFIPIYLD